MADFTRREFLKLVGAGGAAALGLPGCKPPRDNVEKLVSQLIPPENIIPGIPTWYATTCGECPAGCGLLLKVREGRVIKVEGNPAHPISGGRHCMRGEAALQGLYNPDRIRTPLYRKGTSLEPISWDEALSILEEQLKRTAPRKVAWMTPPLTGAMEELLGLWTQRAGGIRWVPYEPLAPENLREAARRLFGKAETPVPDFEQADLILSFGADFLETWLSPVELTRTYAARRIAPENRLRHIQVEARLSLTGSNADRWISPKPGTEALVAGLLLHEVIASGLAHIPVPQALKAWAAQFRREEILSRSGLSKDDLHALLQALREAHRPLILGGNMATEGKNGTALWTAALALTALLNEDPPLRLAGPTVWDRARSFSEVARFVEGWGEETEVLLVYDRNPLYTLPAGLKAEEARNRLKFLAVFTPYLDETAEAADLVLPIRHFIEDWGDSEPRPGIYALQQPGMQPVPHFDSRPFGDLLLELGKALGFSLADSFTDFLKARWRRIQRALRDSRPFETFWTEALRQGGVFRPQPGAMPRLRPEELPEVRLPGSEGEAFLTIYPSLRFYDGRMANRPWIQEVPDPLTKVAWNSVLEIHPEEARKRGLRDGDVVRLQTPAGEAEVPVRLYPRIHPATVALSTGQGHTAFGAYAKGRGVNPFRLLSGDAEPASGALIGSGIPVRLEKTGKRVRLAHTDGSQTDAGRGIVRFIPLAIWKEKAGHLEPPYEEVFREEFPATAKFEEEYHKEHFEEHESPYHWGIAVDLEKCTGCSACTVACMAENNIPVVGEKLVAQGREMFWIRIERYFDEKDHRVHFIPMMCQQCDNAPCEPVCPVFATMHNSEGLNEQVYNRCVGTRYCSNNCPYKVRRFNWYTFKFPEPLNWQLNPDVTVREKGVMEKCTFCYQRIRFAKDQAKDEGRLVREGEIQPACVQACPAEALVFGNLKDPESRVAQLARNPRRYRVLEHLNTQPSVTYLKSIKEAAGDELREGHA